jgi:uncharacterized membrane protein
MEIFALKKNFVSCKDQLEDCLLAESNASFPEFSSVYICRYITIVVFLLRRALILLFHVRNAFSLFYFIFCSKSISLDKGTQVSQ